MHIISLSGQKGWKQTLAERAWKEKSFLLHLKKEFEEMANGTNMTKLTSMFLVYKK